MYTHGFKQLKHVRDGELFMLKPTGHQAIGEVALMSQYGTNDSAGHTAHLCGSGEVLHVDPDEWVLVIDIDLLADYVIVESGRLVWPG